MLEPVARWNADDGKNAQIRNVAAQFRGYTATRERSPAARPVQKAAQERAFEAQVTPLRHSEQQLRFL
jgi:hypothetical protein